MVAWRPGRAHAGLAWTRRAGSQRRAATGNYARTDPAGAGQLARAVDRQGSLAYSRRRRPCRAQAARRPTGLGVDDLQGAIPSAPFALLRDLHDQPGPIRFRLRRQHLEPDEPLPGLATPTAVFEPGIPHQHLEAHAS